ncbi:cysteine-rich receptor-like protein kinase 27 isoform X1 [Triticum urartu]|uniref:cysteine-rich receptor-like protein kinase 27 isoform X1 n=1 Tax=Triticum urartu TaxID=4572 RepID=UPI0020431CD1|nr:cysteine-rich receptor-like protein kinase 27 isoform X1 [Triticum urartu]
MARQCLFLLLVAVTVMAFGVAGASKDVTGGYLLYDCDPDPRRPAKGTAFGARLRPLLAALPSAAAPTGFAFLHSGRAGRSNGTAFARALCFGESPARGDCRECLATAVERIGFCDGSRRAAFWNDGCFLAYSDTNASVSAPADERRWMSFLTHDPVVYPRFYDAETLVGLARSLLPRAAANGSGVPGRMLAAASAALRANGTVRAVAQCAPWNVTAAECALCLAKSVRDVPGPGGLFGVFEGVRSGVASVHRYDCNLRFEISAPVRPVGKGARIRKKIRDNLLVVIVGAVVIVVAVVAGAAFLLVRRKKKMRKGAQAGVSPPTPS